MLIKCKLMPNCDLLYFIFVQISLENCDGYCIWHCIYKDAYNVFVKHTCIWSSETEPLVTNPTLNDGRCHFWLNGQFLKLFNLETFLQYFKPNNSKSNHDNPQKGSYFYHVDNVKL